MRRGRKLRFQIEIGRESSWVQIEIIIVTKYGASKIFFFDFKIADQPSASRIDSHKFIYNIFLHLMQKIVEGRLTQD